MITFLSLVTATKDYFEIVNKLIEFNPNYTILDYQEFGSIFSFVILTVKNVISQVFSLNWLHNLWNWPIMIPDISSSMISEISILDKISTKSLFNYLETPLGSLGANNNASLYTLEKFSIGLINSCFLILPTSAAHIIMLRRFIFQGLEAGYLAGLGTILGNIFFIGCIIFGCRFFIIPWLSLDIFRYLLGFVILIKFMWHASNETRKTNSLNNLAKSKILLLNFLLALTEQTSIYPFLSNLSISPESSILEVFPANNYLSFIFIHLAYILGIFAGSLSLLHLTCWLWENPLYKFYLWFITLSNLDLFKGSQKNYYKYLNFSFLYLTMLCSLTSIPYFGLDYTVTNPLGLVFDDRILYQNNKKTNQSEFPEFGFLNTQGSNKNNRDSRGRHGRRERWKDRLIKYRGMDTSLYEQSIYDLLTIEDLNYGFDKFWMRRKIKNHHSRFRMIIFQPWLLSLKKQLAKPLTKNNSTPIGTELFRMLYEQFYHPIFHSYDLNNTLMLEGLDFSKDSSNPSKNNNSPKKNLYVAEVATHQTKDTLLSKDTQKKGEKRIKDLQMGFDSIGSLQKKNSLFEKDKTCLVHCLPYHLPTDSKATNTLQKKLALKNSILRKFARKTNTRIKSNSILLNSKLRFPSNSFNKNIYSNYNIASSPRFGHTKSQNFNLTPIQLERNGSTARISYKTLIFNKKNFLNTKFSTFETKEFNNSKIMLHPIKYYLQKEKAFKRKFKFYGTNIYRKFSINNNAPFFRIMMRRLFYYYKPTLRWTNTLKLAKNKQGHKVRRKKSRKPLSFNGKLTRSASLAATTTATIEVKKMDTDQSLATSSLIEGNRGLATLPKIPRFLEEPRFGPGGGQTEAKPRKQDRGAALIGSTNKEILYQKLDTGLTIPTRSSGLEKKPTNNYRLSGKRSSRYRFQIYKDVLQHWYYTPFNRLLLKFDIDSFINRQPKSHFLTKNEEQELHVKRFLLTKHFETLRWYTVMQHYQTMKTTIGGTKSFANGFYNQQFQGTFKKIRHLFSITPEFRSKVLIASPVSDSNKQKKEKTDLGIPILKYDQALYNEYFNTEKKSVINSSMIHEELRSNILKTGFKTLPITMNRAEWSTDNGKKPSKPPVFEPRLGQTPQIQDQESTGSSPERTQVLSIFSLPKPPRFLKKLFKEAADFRFSKDSSKKVIIEEWKKLATRRRKKKIDRTIAPEIFKKINYKKKLLSLFFINKSSFKKNDHKALSSFFINSQLKNKENSWFQFFLLKNYKKNLYDQEFLTKFFERRIKKKEKRQQKKEKLLKARLKKVKLWLGPNYLAPLDNYKSKGSLSLSLTTGLANAIKDGYLMINPLNSPSVLSSIDLSRLGHPALATGSKKGIFEAKAPSKTRGIFGSQTRSTLTLEKQPYNQERSPMLQQEDHIIKKQFNLFKSTSFLKMRLMSHLLFIQFKNLGTVSHNFIKKKVFKALKSQSSLNNWELKEKTLKKRKRSRKKYIKEIKKTQNTYLTSLKEKKQNNIFGITKKEPSRIQGRVTMLQRTGRSQSSLGIRDQKNHTSSTNSKNYKISIKRKKEASNLSEPINSNQIDYGPTIKNLKQNFLFNRNGLEANKNSKISFSRKKTKNRRNQRYGRPHHRIEHPTFIPHLERKSANMVAEARLNLIKQQKALPNGQRFNFLLEQKKKKVKKHTWKKFKKGINNEKLRKAKKFNLETISLQRTNLLIKKFNNMKLKLEFQEWWWKQFSPSLEKSTTPKIGPKSGQLLDYPIAPVIRNSPWTIYDPFLFNKNFRDQQRSGGGQSPFQKSPLKNRGIVDPDFWKPNRGFPDQILRSKKVTVNWTTKGDVTLPIPHKEANWQLEKERQIEKKKSTLSKKDILEQEFETLSSQAEFKKTFLVDYVDSLDFKNSPLAQFVSLDKRSPSYSSLLSPTNNLPFYAGWDESLRKFVITNRLLSRREAGFILPSTKMNSNLAHSGESINFTNTLQGMNAGTTLYCQLPFTTFDPDQLFSKGMDGFAPIGWTRFNFTNTILKTPNLENKDYTFQTVLGYGDPKVWKNSVVGMTALDPSGQKSGDFWKGGQTPVLSQDQNQEPKIEKVLSFGSSKNFKQLFNRQLSLNLSNSCFSKAITFKDSQFLGCVGKNKKYNNYARRIKKHYKQIKKSQNEKVPVFLISGPLVNQVLPINYINAFNKQNRLSRDRYLKRRFRRAKKNIPKTIKEFNSKNSLISLRDNNEQFKAFQPKMSNFTLRKRLKSRRKYHRKPNFKALKTIEIRPRRHKFFTKYKKNLTFRAPYVLQQKRKDYMNNKKQLRKRPSKRTVKKNRELDSNSLKNRKKLQKITGLNSRLRQLRRRISRQIVQPIPRRQPRNGGFLWPGDYLRLEQTESPKLILNFLEKSKVLTKTEKFLNRGSSKKGSISGKDDLSSSLLSSGIISPDTAENPSVLSFFSSQKTSSDQTQYINPALSRKSAGKKKSILLDLYVQPRQYLLEKHNIKLLKKKIEMKFA